MMNPVTKSLNVRRSRWALLPSSKLMALAVWLALLAGCRSQTVPTPQLTAESAPPKQADAAPRQPVATKLHTPAGDAVQESIDYNNLELPDAIQMLGKQAGLNVQIDPALLNQQAADGTPIPTPEVSGRWKNVTPLQVLDALLANYGWTMEWTSNNPNVRIHAGIPNMVEPRMTKVNLLEKAPANMAAGDVPTEIKLDNVALPGAIRSLANQLGWNIEFDPLLAQQDANHQPIPLPQVTEHWKAVTCRQALQALLDKYGWEMTQLPGNPVLRIGAKKPEVNDAR
jgi:hypothetical protein